MDRVCGMNLSKFPCSITSLATFLKSCGCGLPAVAYTQTIMDTACGQKSLKLSKATHEMPTVMKCAEFDAPTVAEAQSMLDKS
jgi:hypothetical protein